MKAIFVTILSTIINIMWILGLIFANIKLFIIAMVLLTMTIIYSIKNFKELDEFFKNLKLKDNDVVEDERTEYINERASVPAFGSLMAISIYTGIAIFTLRNSYPQFELMSYAFIFIGIIGIIIFMICRTYYKKKYGS